MLIPANAEDPAPFNALNATANGILSAQSQMAVFRFQVWRLGTEWRSVIPVLAVAGMCSLVFCIPEEDLTPRLEVVAALFLTLVGKFCFESVGHMLKPAPLFKPVTLDPLTPAAFAFSMGEPAAFVQTYVPPALQLLQITGLYLLLAAFESVTVFHIANRARFRERRKVRSLDTGHIAPPFMAAGH